MHVYVCIYIYIYIYIPGQTEGLLGVDVALVVACGDLILLLIITITTSFSC